MKLFLKYIISASCIVYVIWGVDFKSLANHHAQFNLPVLLAGQSILILSFLPAAIRIQKLSGTVVSLKNALGAVLVGFAGNTLLPVRLGEVAKTVALTRQGGLPVDFSMCVVFWERFADLNCLFIIAATTALLLKLELALIPILSILCIAWASLFTMKTNPKWTLRAIGIIPHDGLRQALADSVSLLTKAMSATQMFQLAAYTVVTWGAFIAAMLLMLLHGIALEINSGQALAIIVAGALGIAIPSAPAAVGVYEAFVVSALMFAGVEKELALAAAIALHAAQTIIPASLGLAASTKMLSKPLTSIGKDELKSAAQ